MSFSNWKIDPVSVFSISPVVPVIVIQDIEQALPLAEAIFAGGISILEVTLRTAVAMDALRLLVKSYPQALIGAGTIINTQQLREVEDLGCKFAISPGLTEELLLAGQRNSIALIPGIASVSELMAGMQLGYKHFKFFPASLSGGPKMLKTLATLFPDIQFCPTGGIHEGNYQEYLQLSNVACVGGSWIVPQDVIRVQNWSLITQLCSSVGRI